MRDTRRTRAAGRAASGPDGATEVIAVGSADRAPDPAVLRSPGGFSWFYVDLVDDGGRGATLIWSWGLPFLPGYAGAARSGRAQRPADRPSVNLVVYEGGRERFYLLSEFDPTQCDWGEDGRSWRVGGCSFTWTDAPGPAGAGPTRTLRADLDLALPTGGRARGELRMTGPLRRDPPDTARANPGGKPARHEWTPMIAAAHGCLELHTPGGLMRVRGRAYHDRNSSALPLQALGIQSWRWGRLALPGRDLVFYRLVPSAPEASPRDLVVEVSADGSCRLREQTGLEVRGLRRSLWGMDWPREVGFRDPDGRPVEVRVSALLDNGPFYQRYLLSGRCGSDRGYGIGETLVPERVDTDLLRPLVRMRVHRAHGPNSMWLPLFAGDGAGRWRRLLAGLPGGSGGVDR
jgi:carotenoid 1,2-hydratase